MLYSLGNFVENNKSETAWLSYKDVVLALSKGKSVLEVGAGRRPIFTEKEIKYNNISYVANDIIKKEIDYIEFDVEKAVFDISGVIPEKYLNRFDFVFSRMVQEHVTSGERFYKNIYSILSDGGVSLNFFPTLFHPIFILNYILPSKVSQIFLQSLHPRRNSNEIPKFPAYYHYCFSTDEQIEKIRKCGFKEVYIYPFYGQSYLENIPFLSFAANIMDNWFRENNIKTFSAFAYSFVIK